MVKFLFISNVVYFLVILIFEHVDSKKLGIFILAVFFKSSINRGVIFPKKTKVIYFSIFKVFIYCKSLIKDYFKSLAQLT